MHILIPDTVFQKTQLSEPELLLEFSIWLYEKEIVSMRAAAGIAGISWVEYEAILAKRKIAMHYGKAELEEDLKSLEKLDK